MWGERRISPSFQSVSKEIYSKPLPFIRFLVRSATMVKWIFLPVDGQNGLLMSMAHYQTKWSLEGYGRWPYLYLRVKAPCSQLTGVFFCKVSLSFQLGDPSILPEFPYRDDGLLLYDAIKKYVADIVNIYYGNLDYCQYISQHEILANICAGTEVTNIK